MKRSDGALIGAGVAACAVCCAGPILGVLSAIGLGSVLGASLFGAGALVIGVAAAVFVVVRRRRRAAACAPAPVEVAVAMPSATVKPHRDPEAVQGRQ